MRKVTPEIVMVRALCISIGLFYASAQPTGTVLVETPRNYVAWNEELLQLPSSGVGISGTHTTQLHIAKRFAKAGFDTFISGNVVIPQSSPSGLNYVDGYSGMECPGEVNVLITSSIFGPLWEKCDAEILAVVMAEQHFVPESKRDAMAVILYVERQRQNNPGFKLILFHLSEWGLHAFRRISLREGLGEWLIDGEDQGWLQHDTGFRNAVDEALILQAEAKALPRNEASMIFPACFERGASVAARVFHELENENWGNESSGLWVTYDFDDEKAAPIKEVVGEHGLVRGPMNKVDLMDEFQKAGFFVYGLWYDKNDLIHIDTFGMVVAEALASGVVVLAPPVGPLPELYKEHVVWIEPDGGLSTVIQEAYTPEPDSSLGSDAIVQKYVRKITDMMKQPNATAQRRLDSRNFVMDTFISNNTTGYLLSKILLAWGKDDVNIRTLRQGEQRGNALRRKEERIVACQFAGMAAAAFGVIGAGLLIVFCTGRTAEKAVRTTMLNEGLE